MTAQARQVRNLPVQLSSFIGREREMARVRDLLASARLVTLTSAGGSGKTRLALRVAQDLTHLTFPDGVWFVDLSALSDPLLVPHTVASALGVRAESNRPILAILADYLRQRQTLLLLDNCEHLIDASAHLAEHLLLACPQLKVLVTSREPLGIPGESVFNVPPLSLPAADPSPRHGLDTQVVLASEAVRLFVERAVAVQADFQLTPANAPAVMRICRGLDGIPLALELAAARVRSLSVEQITARLDDRFRLLTGGSRTALPRQQTLRATIDWSHDLLSEAERTLFQRVSVFAGGWTLEAAEAVCSGQSSVASIQMGLAAGYWLPATDILDLLTQLLNKSLVLAQGQNGHMRYGFLETIREYATERLQASGEAEALRTRHLEWFLRLAEESERKLVGTEPLTWLNRMETEHDNLRAAMQWSIASGQAALGVHLASAITEFWLAHGYHQEGQAWFERLLSQPAAQARSATRAQALWGAGRMVAIMRGNGAARARLEESVNIWRELDDERGLGRALRDLAYLRNTQGEPAAARPLLEESVRLFRRLGERWELALALNFLGSLPDLAYATRCLEESLSLFRELNHPRGIGIGLMGLSNVAIAQGDFSKAKAYLEESVALRSSVKDEAGVARALQRLGTIALLEGDVERASRAYTQALERFQGLGHAAPIAHVLYSLGYAALYQGEHARALVLLRQSLDAHRESADFPGTVGSLIGLASWAAAQGLFVPAARLLASVSAHLESRGLSLTAIQRALYDRYMHMGRSQLSAAAFDKAWAEGRRLTLDAASAEAFQLTSGEQPSAPSPTPPRPAGLTQREVEVLRWLAQGLTNAEMAAQLGVSSRTVDAHLRSIYGKLDVTTRTAAAHYAVEYKLV